MVKAGGTLRPDVLTVNERVLLHLRESGGAHDPSDAYALTQPGIAEGVGIRVNHVSRAVKQLIRERLVAEGTARVRGEVRKRKAYTVTAEGHAIAQRLAKEVAARNVVAADGVKERTVSANEARKLVSPPTLTRLLACIDAEGRLDMREPHAEAARPVPVFEEGRPVVEELLSREGEIAAVQSWLRSGPPILLLIGPRGVGKSALVSACLPPDRPRFWWSFRPGDRADPLLSCLAAFLAEFGRGDLRTRTSGAAPPWREVAHVLARDLRGTDAILVLDDAHLAGPDLAPYLVAVYESAAEARCRVAVIGETALPRRDELLAARKLRELRLRGLDREGARALLAEDLPDAEFEKAYRLTKGNPLSLKLLAAEQGPEGYTPEERALLKVLRMRQDDG